MSTLDALKRCTGRWQGTNRVEDYHHGIREESSSTAIITPILKETFLRIDYEWSFKGTPQEGMILLGLEAADQVATGHWIDSWHMSDVVMASRGSIDATGAVNLLGSYTAPPGPDWGWRTILSAPHQDSFQIIMYNITPEGREELAVEALYHRTV